MPEVGVKASGFGYRTAQSGPATVASFRTRRGLRAELARGPKPDPSILTLATRPAGPLQSKA